MAEKFNPLKSWLGITTSGKPSYYDLIGLANFESEPPIIADAANSAIAKVSENLNGEHHAIAEKLVRDLKGLKGVLLSADKRRAYDDQLRSQLGLAAPLKAASPASPGMLPPSIEAADSPTMMLPPGALSALRSLDQVLGSAPPEAPSYGSQPGTQPGYLLGGGAPAPAYGAPGYGAPQHNPQQYGAPQSQYGGPQAQGPNPYQQAPYGADPNAGYNPNGYPNNAYGAPQGMGQPQQPYAGPMGHMGSPNQGYEQPGFGGNSYGVPQMGVPQMGAPQMNGPMMGGPNLGLGGPSPLPGDPMGFGGPGAVGTLPRVPASKPRPRAVAPAAKAQGSNVTLALIVLGGAAAILAIVIIVVQKNKGNNQAVPIASKPRDTMNKPLPVVPTIASAPLRTPFESKPLPPRGKLPGEDVPVMIDVSKERDNMMNVDTIVPKMLPEGSTPAMGTPTPSATAEPAKPAAKPKATLLGVDGLKGVVIEPVAMEPALPEDAVRAKSVPTMLKGSRGSMRTRDYNKAEETILLAQITADTPALVRKSLEHARALDLMRGFWTSVRDGIKKLKAGDELTFAAKTGVVVKHDDVSLVVKLDGKDIPLMIDKLVPALAVQLAERSIGNEAPAAKLVLGTFMVLDQDADHARGFELIEQSEGGDIIVGDYIDILKATD